MLHCQSHLNRHRRHGFDKQFPNGSVDARAGNNLTSERTILHAAANEKPIVYMGNSSYFLFSVPAGDVNFTSGDIRNNFPSSNVETAYARECKATINVKRGYVYYLKLKMIPMPFWTLFLDHVPHQESANIIESYDFDVIVISIGTLNM